MKIIKRLLILVICLAALGAALMLAVSGYVKLSEKDRLLSVSEAAELSDVDCIVVLGCQVRADGSPSAMLRERLMRSVELYEAGASRKILMSGDHRTDDYNEVDAMVRFAVENGVPDEDVLADPAGLSTYISVYRARDVFRAKKVVIVTQEYHLYRALYIAERLGLDAYGVACDQVRYSGQGFRDIREALARCKDLVKCILEPGREAIPTG